MNRESWVKDFLYLTICVYTGLVSFAFSSYCNVLTFKSDTVSVVKLLPVFPGFFHPYTHSLLVFGDPRIFLYFSEAIRPSPVRAPGRTAARAKRFICDYWL